MRRFILHRHASRDDVLNFNVLVNLGPVEHAASGTYLEVRPLLWSGGFQAGKTMIGDRDLPLIRKANREYLIPDNDPDRSRIGNPPCTMRNSHAISSE